MAEDGIDELLVGGWQTEVRSDGKTVRRTSGPWSPAVIHFLNHLQDQGFLASPRPIGSGFDAAGYETLEYMRGQSPHPRPWTNDAIYAVGQLLASLHEAARSYQPPPNAIWKAWFGRQLGDSSSGFGHGDLGPWNIMAVDGHPTGFIDWDTAGPIDPLWELAHVAWLNAHLHDDDVAELAGLRNQK